MRKSLLVVSLIAFSACVAQEPWTRERAEAVTTRQYSSYSTAQVLDAAENVFILAGSPRSSFSYSPSGFTASRPINAFLVIAVINGSYILQAEVLPDKTLRANFYANLNSTTANVMVPGSPIVNPSSGATPVVQKATYDLFFARVEYLLGLRSDWISCDEVREVFGVGELQVEALCVGSPDRSPTRSAT